MKHLLALYLFLSAFIPAQNLTDSNMGGAKALKNINFLTKSADEDGFYRLSSFKYFSIEGSSILEIRDTFTYNIYGALLTGETQLLNEGKWEMHDSIRNEYDGKGRLTSHLVKAISDEGWNIEREEYSYGAMDSVSQMLIYIGGTNKPSSKYIYERNEKGRLLTQHLYSAGTLDWDEKMIYEYKYDSFGHDTSMICSELYEGAWIKKYSISKIYNTRGDIEELMQSSYSTSDEPYFITKYDYIYSDNGELKSFTQTEYEGGVWRNIRKIEYSSENNGNVKISAEYYWKNEGWAKKERIHESYQEGFVMNIFTEISPDGSTWANSNRVMYQYGANLKPANVKSENWEDGAWKEGNGNLFIDPMRLCYGTSGEAAYVFIKNPIGVEEEKNIPANFSLGQNYPNPFNPETKISFNLPVNGKTSLKVYDMLGREVAELVNGELEKGTHTINFNGRSLSSGVYIYRLQSGAFTESKKMILMK
ncbi:MAG TPA: T9SS type A sorting domain-containing protein [Ignavibacteriales bacterium]|nr:T9SS type A sorting domain-containing protein [Ignavibacteriales bacterium]